MYCDYALGIIRGFLQNAVCHRRPHPPSLLTWASAFFQDPLQHACQPTKWGSTVMVITFFHPSSISCHDANVEMCVLHTWQVWFEILSRHLNKILQSSSYSWSVCTKCTDSGDALSWQTYFKIKKVRGPVFVNIRILYNEFGIVICDWSYEQSTIDDCS